MKIQYDNKENFLTLSFPFCKIKININIKCDQIIIK